MFTSTIYIYYLKTGNKRPKRKWIPQIVVYSYSEIIPNNKKKWIIDIFQNIDEVQKYKAVRKSEITHYMIPFIGSPERGKI